MAISALARKSWTDLSRRPARAVLTTLTLALAVSSFGILALPALMNRAMTSEVAQARLFDLSIPIDAVVLSPAQLHRLAALPNVAALTARTTFSTRTLIGERRVNTEVWGVPSFTDQPVDTVISSARPGPDQVVVDERDASSSISKATAGDVLRVQSSNGSFRSLLVAGVARGMAFNQGALNGDLILYAPQPTVQAMGGLSGVNLLEMRLANTNPAAVHSTEAEVRLYLASLPRPTTFSGLPTVRAPGDWPLKDIFNSRVKILDILIGLAVLSALFLLANTIRTLVAEQSREIGVMRAVGASGRDVRNSYLRTAAILGVMGAAVGSVVGIGLAYLLARLFGRLIFGVSPGFAVDWPVVGIGALVGLAGTILTAWPTLRGVLRTPVHEALASDGPVSEFGGSRIDRSVLAFRRLPAPVRVGMRNIARQKGRSATTVAQVALAVGTLLGLVSLASAVSEVTNQSWDVLAYDIGLSAQQGGTGFSPSVVSEVRAQPGVAGVEAADWSQLSYRGQTLFGLGSHAASFVREPLASGRWLSPSDEVRGTNVAIIGSAAARRWALAPGSRLTVTSAGGPVTLMVIGVGASQANNGYNLYTTLGVIQRATGHPGVANTLLIRSTDKGHQAIDALANRLEATVAELGSPSRSQIIYAGRATDQASAHSTLVIVESIGLLIVAISMLGLVNAITMSIIERTREIGVLRCLGARGRDLRRIFRAETISLALTGFVVSIPLGWLIARALQWLVLRVVGGRLPAPYTLGSIGVALVGTAVLAVLVVAGPLRRATRLRPGEAIRYN